MRFADIEIFQWVKRQPDDCLDLASSGVHGPLTVRELGIDPGDLPLSGPNPYGYGPLKEVLAAMFGVGTERVVVTPGASLANYAVMAALTEAGDAVMVESPCYQPFVRVAQVCTGREPAFLPRVRSQRYTFALPDVTLTELKPKLLILTNLHNPSGMRLDLADLARLAEETERWGGWVLVDEIFLPFMEDGFQTGATIRPNIIATCSLTKAWGLPGLRVGWAIAPESIARRLETVIDHLHVCHGFISEYLAWAVLQGETGPRLLEAARQTARENYRLVDAFLKEQTHLDWTPPDGGITVWLTFRDGRDASPFCDRLRTKHRTLVQPGRFFGVDSGFRLGFGETPERLRQGLAAVQAELDERE